MRWNWNGHKVEVEGFPRVDGPTAGHLTECLVVYVAASGQEPTEGFPYCTCDDWGPE